jgi:hypothetical protein
VTRNHLVAIAIAIVCTVLPFAGQFYGDRAAGGLMIDFRAYYCAASALGRHENPYFIASLHPCERAPAPPFYRAPANVTVPAPYPPYVLILIYPLTLLPFSVAAMVWWLILGLCLLLATYALARVTRQPPLIAWAVLALSLGLTSLTSGNMVTICVTALLIAALWAQQGYFQAAAFAIALAMVEPQLALPAAIAVFIRFPAARLFLVLLGALFAAGSLAASGLAQSLAYITTVLPAHALSEVSRDNQYSLSTIVAALGVPDAQAVIIGSISYVVMATAGIIVGLRLARDYHEPAFALLVPPAFSLFGGTFVHTGEFAIAAPACLLLLVRTKTYRGPLLVVVALLAVPWMLATSLATLFAPVFPVAVLVYVLGGRDRILTLASVVSSLAVIGLLFFASHHSVSHGIVHDVLRPRIDERLAEASWRDFVLTNSTNRLAMWLLRAPTWLGLVGFVLFATAAIRGFPLRHGTVAPYGNIQGRG